MLPRACYSLPENVGVTCPECGAGGGSSGPCYCHKCDYHVMMLPSINGRITGNWGEYLRQIERRNQNAKRRMAHLPTLE